MNFCFNGFSGSLLPARFYQFGIDDGEEEPICVINLVVRDLYETSKSCIYIGEWKNFRVYLIQNALHYLFISNDESYGFFQICLSHDFASIDIAVPTLQKVECNALYDIILYCVQLRMISIGNIPVHGAVVSYEDCAIVFSGASGAGKSTQADLWKKYVNAKVINYDKPFIVVNGNEYYISGSPWSGKESCYINEKKRLKAIVFVEKDTRNYAIELSKWDAATRIHASYMIYPIRNEISDNFIESVTKLVESIPVYELHCTIDKDAVVAAYKAVFGKNISDFERMINDMRISNKFIVRNIAGDYVAFTRGVRATEKNLSIVLNDTGMFLWKQLEGGSNKEKLILSLSEEYGIDKETSEHDVMIFLGKLRKVGAIEEDEA